MSNIRDIKNKIKHIKSTQKITGAMEMVAASKMRKAQERTFSSRPYAAAIKEVIAHLTDSNIECEHSYLIERKVKRAGFIVISTDRGLCGGLNMNLFRETINVMQDLEEDNIAVDVCAIGNKANLFFKRYKANIIAKATILSDSPSIKNIIGLVKVLLDEYEDKKIDNIYIAHNVFVNTMVQVPRVERF